MRNTVTCGVCAQPASLVAYNEGLDGKRWSCRGCNWRQSIRQGSFFSGSHLTLQEIILLMYFWAHDAPQTTMAHETGIERDETIVDWCNFCRDICETWVEENGEEIGGMTDQGEAIVVEIDETKYFRRKYHRGQWREGHWVFGGIERGTGRCFLVEVPNRTAKLKNAFCQAATSYLTVGLHVRKSTEYAVAYTRIQSLSMRTTLWTMTTPTHIHKTWRTCGCGPKENLDVNSAPAGNCSLPTSMNSFGETP